MELPDLTMLIDGLRRSEPAARAFFVFGSFARNAAGPFSDIDLRVITLAAPVERDRVAFISTEGQLLHVSIGARPLAELIAGAGNPATWPWLAGFCAHARVLDDPEDLLALLRAAVEVYRPAVPITAGALHISLETLIEEYQKLRTAHRARATAALFWAAQHLAAVAAEVLISLNPPAALASNRDQLLRITGLAVAPAGWATDYLLLAGLTPEARPVDAIAAAATRVVEGALTLVREHADALPLSGALGGYLLDGTLLRYVRQGT